jgi:dipeptidase E
MKLLLTSGGISNPSIRNALVDLLGKPIAEANALIIPTAAYGCAGWGPGIAWRLISGTQQNPLCELGWKSLGVLELTALPSLDERDWVPSVRETDALLVGGGDPLYLRNWMRQSGLAELFASLRPEFVYVGLSAGSMAVTSHFGEAYTSRKPRGGGDFTLEELDYVTLEGQPGVVNFVSAPGIGLVDFTLFPHLGDAAKPDASLANVERWAARVPVPMYAIDDQTAIKVTGGDVEVVSEGHWKLFTSATAAARAAR